MAITLTLGVAAVAGAGASIYSANKGAKAAKSAAAQQNKYAQQNFDLQSEYLKFQEGAAAEFAAKSEELIGESKGITEDAYSRITGIINAIPSIETLYPRGEGLSRKDFDFRTAIKRENLAFILGKTDDELRNAQQSRSELANLEEGAFVGKFNKIIRSNLLGLKATTIGEPTGTFANLSAKNLYDFSSKALSEFLAINDFYAKEGTVDPISPYAISQDLYTNEFNLAGQKIGNERWRAESLININGQAMGVAGQNYTNASQINQMGMQIGQQYYNALGQSAGISAGADAARAQGISQGIGILAQGAAGIAGYSQQQQALNMQKQYQTALINSMNSGSLQGFAPATIRGTSPTVGSISTSRPSSSSSSNLPLPKDYPASPYMNVPLPLTGAPFNYIGLLPPP